MKTMMTNEQKEAIRHALLEWIKAKGLSDTEITRRYEFKNPAYFNQVKNGTYTDKYPKPEYFEHVAATIGYIAKPVFAWQHADLSSYTTIKALCAKAHTDHDVRVLDAPTGSGKSYSLEAYFREPAYPTKAYYFRASDENITPAEFMRRLLKLMGKKKVDSIPIARLTHECIAMMRQNGGVLMLDEMEYLSNASLKQVRKLVYETEGRFGFVLCGAGISQRLERLASTKTAQQQGWAQLWSRLKWRCHTLTPFGWDDNDPDRSDRWKGVVREVAKANGKVTAKGITFLARHTDNLRDLNRVLTDAFIIAGTEAVTDETIKDAMTLTIE